MSSSFREFILNAKPGQFVGHGVSSFIEVCEKALKDCGVCVKMFVDVSWAGFAL